MLYEPLQPQDHMRYMDLGEDLKDDEREWLHSYLGREKVEEDCNEWEEEGDLFGCEDLADL